MGSDLIVVLIIALVHRPRLARTEDAAEARRRRSGAASARRAPEASEAATTRRRAIRPPDRALSRGAEQPELPTPRPRRSPATSIRRSTLPAPRSAMDRIAADRTRPRPTGSTATERGATLSSRDAEPAKSAAARGSAAASPQTPTGRPWSTRPCRRSRSRRRTAGWNGVARSASAGFVRSAATVYWTRSLVPMLKKSTSRRQRIRDQRRRRDLDHHAETDVAGDRGSVAASRGSCPRSSAARPARTSSRVETIGRRMRSSPSGGGLEQRPKLRFEEFRPAQPQTDAANAERRVRLRLARLEARGLVPADVQGPEDDRPTDHRVQDPAVDGSLLVQPRGDRPAEEDQLRSDESDAVGAGPGRLLGLGDRTDVRLDPDPERERLARGPGDARDRGDRRRGRLVTGPRGRAISSAFGSTSSASVAAVDRHGSSGEPAVQGRSQTENERDAERPGDDRSVAVRGAGGQGQTG